MSQLWYWPDPDSLNDYPDPLGVEDEWHQWLGTMEAGPSVFAEIFSREFVQNAWDSIQAKARKLDGAGPKPRVDFSFVELSGDDAETFARNFGLKEHVARLAYLRKNKPEQLKDNRLGDSPFVMGDLSTIRVLVANEWVGDGMSGKWITKGDLKLEPSRMKYALVQSATGKSGSSTGGSWGHGKKAIAAASAVRILGAYTCHPYAQGDDEGVTRRFLGVTYWRQHESATKRHRGLGLCGSLEQGGLDTDYGSLAPLKNDVADGFVRELGLDDLKVRDPESVRDHGTSYLFIEPQFGPEELASAMERNWWPLLLSMGLEIEVLGYDGASVPIQPKARKELLPFIKAWDVARAVDATDEKKEARVQISTSGKDVGALAVVSDPTPEGWSYEPGPGGTNVDLVALIRNDMVIAYQHFPPKRPNKPAPYVRGALVVAQQSDANEMLKMTEGHLHNSWKTESVGDRQAEQLAEDVLKQVNNQVKALRKKIRPEAEAVDIPIRPFRKIFNQKGTSVGAAKDGTGTHDGVQRDFVIRDTSRSSPQFNVKRPTELKIGGTTRIALRPDHKLDEMDVCIDLGWAVYEERGAKRDESLTDSASVSVPPGFSLKDGILQGKLTKEFIELSWKSLDFPDDWRVVPDPKVEPVVKGDEK